MGGVKGWISQSRQVSVCSLPPLRSFLCYHADFSVSFQDLPSKNALSFRWSFSLIHSRVHHGDFTRILGSTFHLLSVSQFYSFNLIVGVLEAGERKRYFSCPPPPLFPSTTLLFNFCIFRLFDL